MLELTAELANDAALDLLADRIAERVAVRLGGAIPEQAEALVDATEIARRYGKTRSWVYEHAGELGAIRLGSGPRPRLGFSQAKAAAALAAAELPGEIERATPTRRRRQRRGHTVAGAALLSVRGGEA